MRENKAAEKLRIIDVIKENAALVLSVGGFVWVIFQFLIIPINALTYQVGDILNNHLKTIQDEQIVATQERKEESERIKDLSEQIVRLTTILENK